MNNLNVIRTRGQTFYPRRHPSLWSVLYDKWLEGCLLQWRTDRPHDAARKQNREAALREALREVGNLGAEFQAGGSPTAVKVLNLASDRITALLPKGGA